MKNNSDDEENLVNEKRKFILLRIKMNLIYFMKIVIYLLIILNSNLEKYFY